MKSISVSQVVAELASRVPSAGPSTSTRLLGRMFHEVFLGLTDPDSPDNGTLVLEDCEESVEVWAEHLKAHAYDRLFGPLVFQNRAALSGSNERLLSAWAGIQRLAEWLAKAYEAMERPESYLPSEQWNFRRASFRSEVRVEAELREEGWRAPVLLRGRVDSILHPPTRPERCLIELKTGRMPDELALAQLCLYDLAAPTGSAGHHHVALLRFGETVEESVIDTAALGAAKQRLLDVIAELAGVQAQVRGQAAGPSPRTGGSEPHTDPPGDAFPQQLRQAFREFGLDVKVDGSPQVGPTFKRYPLQLGRGVQVRRVEQMADEIQVRLTLEQPLIIRRDRGRIVLDVERQDRQTVEYAKVTADLPEPDAAHARSKILVGVQLDGQLRFADLADPTTAHILVAGTTGSGKSEWLRSALATLIQTNTPDTLRLMLIDPKRNAFPALKHSSYLHPSFGLMYPPDDLVEDGLDALIDEMERRYVKLEQARVDTIAELARTTGEILPRIVLACDEFFDLMSTTAKARQGLEGRIAKLGAKARAAGIHLILATQQPSRRVVSGTIDANMSARVALKTSSAIESRTILRGSGAEKLLGHGDLLFKDVGEPVRLQSPLMSPEDRQRLFGA